MKGAFKYLFRTYFVKEHFWIYKFKTEPKIKIILDK